MLREKKILNSISSWSILWYFNSWSQVKYAIKANLLKFIRQGHQDRTRITAEINVFSHEMFKLIN